MQIQTGKSYHRVVQALSKLGGTEPIHPLNKVLEARAVAKELKISRRLSKFMP